MSGPGAKEGAKEKPEPGGGAEVADLARLAQREGASGLMERGADVRYRVTAARALAYADGFSMVAWLGRLATSDERGESQAALDSLLEIAARPTRPVDPEDALEVRAGMADILSVAREKERPKSARIVAVRGLRMFADRGWVKPADVPSDLDVLPRVP
jgi:hypothetical protein